MEKFSLKKVTYGFVQAHSYITVKDGPAIVIDAAAPLSLVSEKCAPAKIAALLLTHGHFDHTDYAAEYNAAGITVYMSAADFQLPRRKFNTDITLTGEETLDIAGFRIIIKSVKGHTNGGLCYYFEEENLVFTGDTLFEGTIGRTDFKDGCHSTLVSDIKNQLLGLPDNTVIYPGHGDSTTVGTEKARNRYLR